MTDDRVSIALVGDLHGNFPAVCALDKDIKNRNINCVYCLGDIVGKGPSSDRTFDWAVNNCKVLLQGNWDSGIAYKEYPMDEFYYNQLGEERMKSLREMPLEFSFTLSGRKIRLFHGRPVMEKLLVIQDDPTLLAPFFEDTYDVVCYADAHRQGMRLVLNKGQMINIGSVGNGLGINMVQYAILTGSLTDEKAPFDITFVTVPYDVEQAVKDTESQTELPNAHLFVQEIKTGVYARTHLQASEIKAKTT